MPASTFRPAIGVVGAGRNGLALAHVIGGAGHPVVLFTTLPERAAALRETGAYPSVLPELERLHPSVEITTDPEYLAARCTIILLTVSSEYFLPVLRLLGNVLDGAHAMVHAVHSLDGPELTRTSQLIGRYTSVRVVGAMAGPTHVLELLSGRPNAMVIGSAFHRVVDRCQEVLESPGLQVVGNKDMVGVELAASLGQVIAIAVGISDGLGLGAANHAVIVARGLTEMSEIGERAGGAARTFSGLAGIGRLVDIIRRGEPNYQLGKRIATDHDPVATIAAAPPEALGVAVLHALQAYGERNAADMPLVTCLCDIVGGRIAPEEGLATYARRHRAYE